ncbi:hypothetical protein ASPZODRAFT_130816 [Penicilliopsis zonata CBS 506.65]|uniref:Signal recognition particle subunit SRP14 n=1 Tax=Penicilliopsis zonata CBS 506.65 TaxID=1073090 RepID=A0A1L9SNL7_9EURO|nr:hypothetical protein ASPZODRAFT_130816 [Penicilliopsis zonata CBS 506.65]OJJ48703.1 hypothetical protein ASPZODRAFT_130816 [Penicilliopsis zonata CBS 506.65]
MAPHLTHEEFFSSLTNLLNQTSQKARGSVFLTQKALIEPTTEEGAVAPSRPSILIRATDGNTSAPNPKSSANGGVSKTKSKASKVKISTVVAADELETFYTRYAEVCKAGMSGLKKRDRKRGKAKKGAAAKVAK